MAGFIAALLFAVTPAELQAYRSDLARLPIERHKYTCYLSLSDVPADKQADLEAVVKGIACSLSSNSHLPSQLPVRVEGTTLLRLSLDDLGWAGHYEREIVQNYPYAKELTRHNQMPWIVSGLWFATNVVDPIKTDDMQYQLLYRGKPPKNLAEFQAFWKIDTKALPWGWIEGNSGVSVSRQRTMASFPVASRGGSAWGTFDFRNLNAQTDPIENLKPFSHKFDASEWIVGNVKTDGRRHGMLVVYWLNDASGNRQEKAPADIVRDNTELRGVEIRNTISCISCHPVGLAPVSVDAYDRYFRSGATATTYDKQTQRDIEAFYESDVKGDLEASQKLFAAGIDMVCGMKAEEWSAAFCNFVRFHDAELSLEQSARELGSTPEELKLALGYQSAKGVNIGAQLSQHAHEVKIPRERFEELQPHMDYYLQVWRATK